MTKIATIISLILTSNTWPAYTQDNAGIRFERELNWRQLLVKAKSEHKYILVDCYATWCRPCKQMDENVYSLKEVGEVYNKDFVSVKVQMDKAPADDEQTKSWYKAAEMLQVNYNVAALPTFLFFDSEGTPVHKLVGYRTAAEFIQLSKDARNPDRQYYQVLKNFHPGTIDTSDLKGLAVSLYNSDKSLAGKLAADYLERIPKAQLGMRVNLQFMIGFQTIPQVLAIAVNYIKSLSKNGFASKDNLRFIEALADHQEVKDIAVDYIRKLPKKAFTEEKNIELISRFRDDTTVYKIANYHIGHLRHGEISNRGIIQFTCRFTTNTKDRGFKILYSHIDKINEILNDTSSVAEVIISAISKSELMPQFEATLKTSVEPDFNQLSKMLKKKYGEKYASRSILNGKVDGYRFLVENKKQSRFWPQLIKAEIDKEQPYFQDSTLSLGHIIDINNTCYNIFLHTDDKDQITIATKWMKKVIQDDPQDAGLEQDTYACVLYKIGMTAEAIIAEKKAVEKAKKSKWDAGIKEYAAKIEKMIAGEKIWLLKEFQ